MAYVKAVPVISSWASVTYTYNGSLDDTRSRMKINDCCHEKAEVVKEKLQSAELRVEDVSKEWLHAQLLFRGIMRPGAEVDLTKRKMFAVLKYHNKVVGDGYYAGTLVTLSRYIHDLDMRWSQTHPEHCRSNGLLKQGTPHNDKRCFCFATKWQDNLKKVPLPAENRALAVVKPKPKSVAEQPALPTAGTPIRVNERVVETSLVHKRPLPNAQESGANSVHPCKKSKLVEPPTTRTHVDNGEGPSSWTASPPGAPPTPPEHVDRLPHEVSTQVPPSVHPRWQGLLDKHHKFKVYNYMNNIGGTYMIQCPMLERTHPELVGRLSIAIRHLGWHSTEHGMLEAYIDFGTFLGPAILGLDSDRTAEYLWATAKEWRSKGFLTLHENSETERLYKAALSVATRRAIAQKRFRAHLENPLTENLRDLVSLEIDTSKPPQFRFQARLNHLVNEVHPSDTYRVTFGHLNVDKNCLSLNGTISISENTGGELRFTGLKVDKKTRDDLPKRWIDVPTGKVNLAV